MTRIALLLLSACLPVAALPVAALAQEAPLPAPVFLGDVALPAGLALDGVELGGLSDLDWDAASGSFQVISDDRVENGPARFYRVALQTREGRLSGVDIKAMHELTAPGGGHFGPRGVDPEGIALDPVRGRMFWSSERDARDVPAIYTARLDGGDARALDLPAAFLPNADHSTGTRTNLGFEGLTLSADGRTLWAAMENALLQDGPKASLTEASPSRIVAFDAATLDPVHQYVYMTETVPEKTTVDKGWMDNGLSALAALPDGRLVSVERSYVEGVGFIIRLFTVDTAGATDVNGEDRVDPAAITPVAKTPWFTLRDGTYPMSAPVDNIEGIAFGPLIGGRQTMLLVSDDNFSASQVTDFALFAVDLPQS